MDFPNVKQEGNYNYNFEEYISPVYNRPYTKKRENRNERLQNFLRGIIK